MTYTIIKIDANGNEKNYGKGYSNINDIVPKNYKFNGMFYTNKNTKVIYIVEED